MQNKFTWRKLIKPELNILIFMIISIVVGISLSPNFLDGPFLLSSMSLYVELGIIALMFTFLMTSGEIDLSIAAQLSLTGCATAFLYGHGLNMVIAIVLGLLLGIALGLVNGILVIVTKLPSLILTIGTMSVYKGLAQVLIGDFAIGDFPEWFNGINEWMLFGCIPLLVLLFFILGIVLEIVMRKTYFGRQVATMGLNREVAKYSGVPVEKMKLLLFGLQGLFCAIAGICMISRLQMAKYTIGADSEMDVVTMVLLGGTAFTGGKGSVIGTILAFLIIVFIRTGMRLALISNYAQITVIGALLILIIILSQFLERHAESK